MFVIFLHKQKTLFVNCTYDSLNLILFFRTSCERLGDKIIMEEYYYFTSKKTPVRNTRSLNHYKIMYYYEV